MLHVKKECLRILNPTFPTQMGFPSIQNFWKLHLHRKSDIETFIVSVVFCEGVRKKCNKQKMRLDWILVRIGLNFHFLASKWHFIASKYLKFAVT